MFLGRDGFVWWIGVVEENNDPLLLCRVKVRIFGYHTEVTRNQNRIPTADLPWASVVLSPNNSTTYSRIGLGEWVIGFFMDGTEAQEPVVFGVIPTPLKEGEVSGTDRFGTYGTSSRTFSHITTSPNDYPPDGSDNTAYQKLLQRKSIRSESGHVIDMIDHVDENVLALGHKDGVTKITFQKDDIVVTGKLGSFNLIDQLDWIANGYTDPNGGKIGKRPPPPPPAPPGGRRRRKIICTKLYELGFLPEDVYNADQDFGERLVETHPDIYNGYVAWAQVVVDWMEGNGPQCMFWIRNEQKRRETQQKLSTSWARKIATPWAVHMAYIMGVEKKDSITGKVLMGVGAPICKIIGWWQRKFGESQKEPGLAKGYALWAIFAILRFVVAIMSLFEGKR